MIRKSCDQSTEGETESIFEIPEEEGVREESKNRKIM